MRSIRKSYEPHTLRIWKRETERNCPENLCYGNLPGDIKDEVKASLLKEQGFLCAYTMQRLATVEECHIEHVQPQNAAHDLDLAYSNMAACFPKDGGDTSYGYGAPVKGGTPVNLNVDFVSPHSGGCETRFLYDAAGNVHHAPNDSAAENTIRLLNIGGKSPLVDLRRRAIETHGLSIRRSTMRTASKTKSAAQSRQFAREVLTVNADGNLEPFCVALAQVATTFADKEEARARVGRMLNSKQRQRHRL